MLRIIKLIIVHIALGFLVTLYATLITLFGLAWVLFLIGMNKRVEKMTYYIALLADLLFQAGSMSAEGRSMSSTSSTTFWLHSSPLWVMDWLPSEPWIPTI